MSLLDRLKARIEASGPLPFDEFMAACLYDPDDGFFTSGPLRSVKSGDFLTSPEVSSWFGRTLGRFVAAELAGAGPGAVVADVGAGSGSLLRALAGELGDGVELWAVEASPAARAALAAGPWTVATDLDALPSRITGVIVANELLDNMPVAVVARIASGWEERRVGLAGGGDALALVPAPPRPAVASWAGRYGGTVPVGGLVEVQLAACAWLDAAVRRLERGAVLVVDYGGTVEELEPRRAEGTLRTYRAHHLGPDPLHSPGATDVTVDVNFTALAAAAEHAGAVVEIMRQDDFLRRWGLDDEILRLRREELELARGDDAMARMRVRAERTDAETLLHPRGLGDFRALVARVR